MENNQIKENAADTWLNKHRHLIFLAICMLIAFLIMPNPFKKPDYNYGNHTEWKAHDNLPVVLEIRDEERCGTVRLSGCTKYRVSQLYLHITLPNRQETFKCWFSSDDSKYFFTDTLGQRQYSGNTLVATLWGAFKEKGAKIEIAEVTYTVARGEKAIARDRPRYCRIKHIKFKHFSDVEHLAWQVTTKGRKYTIEKDKALYPEYLEMYQKYFY